MAINHIWYRNEYAEFQEIKTQTITMEREKDGQAKKAKLFIRLVKHADFQKNYDKFEAIRAENDKNKAPKTAEVTQAWAHESLLRETSSWESPLLENDVQREADYHHRQSLLRVSDSDSAGDSTHLFWCFKSSRLLARYG